jgi:diguanylate cyclase (GGDEF)-like protein
MTALRLQPHCGSSSFWGSRSGTERYSSLRKHLWRLHPPFAAALFLTLAFLRPERASAELFAITTYAAGLAVIRFAGDFINSRRWLWGLATLDIVTLGAASALFPEYWQVLLAIQVAIVSMGWVDSAGVTASLLALATATMTAVGLFVDVDNLVVAVALFALGTASISVTALWSTTERPLSALGESLDSLGTLVWQTDLESRLTEVAGPVLAITGLQPSEIIGRSLADFVGEEEPRVQKWADEMFATGSASFVHRLHVASPRTLRTTVRLVTGSGNGNGNTHIHGVSVDITDGWREGETQRRFATIVDHMRDGLILLEAKSQDTEPTISTSNRASSAILRTSGTLTWAELQHSHPEICQRALVQMATPDAEDRWTYRLSSDGPNFWIGISTYRISEDAIAMQLSDVTEETNHRAELAEASARDGLTGLLNASEFDKRLATRLQKIGTVAVFVIDLDKFKPVNDLYGHGAGNIVLQTIAKRLDNSTKSEDVVARIGGDEFAGFAEGIGGETAIESLRVRLEAACSDPIRLEDGAVVRVGGSVGIEMAQAPQTAADAVDRADSKMYKQKRSADRAAHQTST